MNLAARNSVLICIAIFICIKGLGGAFHRPLEEVGLIAIRSPIVGTLIGMLIIAACWTFREPAPAATAPSPKARQYFLIAFAVLCALAMYNRVQAIHRFPIDVQRADMLPAVQSQIDDFLSGRDPYAPLQIEGQSAPRAYLPGIWLGYLPLRAVGIDIRYLNIFAHLLFYILLVDIFLKNARYFHWRFPASALFFLFMIGMHVYSKEAVREVVDVQTGPFWIAYSVLLWAVMRAKPTAACMAIPYVLACRQPAVLLLLPYFVWLLKTDRPRLGRTLAWSAGIGSFLILPFLVRNPSGFFGATLWHLKLLGQSDFAGMARFYGLGAALHYFEIQSLQLPLQALGIATAVWITCRRKHVTALATLALGGAAYTWMMLWVPVTFPYVFAEPLILLFFLLQAFAQPSPRTA